MTDSDDIFHKISNKEYKAEKSIIEKAETEYESEVEVFTMGWHSNLWRKALYI